MLEQMVSEGVIGTYNGRKGGEAVGAGGVQALSAAPAGWKWVPESEPTQEMILAACSENGRPLEIYDRMRAVLIAALAASPTPPAEWQAAPKAAPGEPSDWKPLKTSKEGRDAVRSFFREKLKRHDFDEYIMGTLAADFACVLGGYLRAAPQKEAQEPANLPDVEDMAHSAVQEALSYGVNHDLIHRWMRAVMDKTVAALTKPAPAPLSDDVVKDAARWRWLSEHIGVAWDEGKFTSLVRIVSDKNRAALNASIDHMMAGDWIDAALAAQGGK
jgi:hypothetical protein